MNLLYITYPLEAFLMLLLPIGLGLLLHHRLGVRWRLFVVGALTFVASQAIHIPLLSGLTSQFAQHVLPAPPAEWTLPFNAILLGLLAGLCEEPARWLAYRFFVKSARTWREGMMFGAGHGGIEAIIIGLSVLVNFLALSVMTDAQTAALPAATQEQVRAFLNVPVYLPLIGVAERVFALCLHLAMSLLVMQSFIRHNILYLLAAILWHTAVDAFAVYAAPTWGIGPTETVLALLTIPALLVIFALRDRSPRLSQAPAAP